MSAIGSVANFFERDNATMVLNADNRIDKSTWFLSINWFHNEDVVRNK